MAFDAQAFRAAYSPPVYKDLQGVEHTGRILSRFQWLAVAEDASTLAEGTPEEQQEKAHRVLTAFFPGDDAVVQEILGLPARLFDDAVAHFFDCQRRPESRPASAPAAAATAE